MKILFLNHEFPPIGGGAANATFYLLKELANFNDLEIDLTTSSPDKKFHKEKFSKTISVYKIPIGVDVKSAHYLNNKKFLIYLLQARKLIKDLLSKREYDLCHAFFTLPAGLTAYLFKKKMPYIVSIRGSDVPGYDERFSFHYKFLSPVIKKIWKNSQIVVANSQNLKNLALKTSPKQKIEVIYNGIDTKEFYPNPIDKDRSLFQIICVAHLIQRKGVEYLIKAVSKLCKDYQIKLIIIGLGDLEKELKNKAKKLGLEKYIEFKGLVPHSRLPEIYNQSDVFVLPSLNEGMSNAALEAMACGLPIILTETGGSKELVQNNGFTVPIKNSQAIVSSLTALIKNKKLRQTMGQKSRQIAENMSWTKAAEDYFKIYTKILNS